MAGGGVQDQLVQLFKAADKDKNGSLNFAEVTELFSKTKQPPTESQLRALFKFCDGKDGDQKITEKEFVEGIKALVAYGQQARAAFKQLDTDGSGFLDKAEVTKLLRKINPQYKDAEINKIITEVDTSKDGKISFEEFVKAFL